jgi:hypothetical protein
MGISEVRSPASSRYRSNKVGSGQPLSPGARSMPGRRADQHEPSQSPPKAHVSLGEGGGEIHVTGPKEHPGERPQERQSPEE